MNKFMNTNKHKYSAKSGFSILETMVASFVLIVGVVVGLELFAPIIIESGQSRDRIVATALAQEGVELVKNVRDNNMVTVGTNAFAGLGTATRCIDKNSNGVAGCVANGQLNISNDWYVHTGGAPSNFKRKVRLNQSGDSLTITSYAVWADGSFPSSIDNPTACTIANKCVFTRTILTAWK